MPRDCPDIHRLQGLLEDDVSDAEAQSLTDHLDGCIRCQQRLESLAGASHLIPDRQNQSLETAASLERVMTGLKTASDSTDAGTNASGPQDRQRPSFLGVSDKPGYLGRFGPFEVISVLGRGGMGIVLKAYDSTLNRVVAVKVLYPQLATLDEARKRFLREARSAATVVHDHIVTIHSVSEANGLPYLVMPLISGGSLQDRLDRHGALATHEVVRWGRQIASGLAAAHARGLVHRDIKPTNILLEETNRKALIADFGLARCGDDGPITRPGFLAGTPQYMAPEQAMGQHVDHRADLFSFGVVLYAMCTGRSAFAGPTAIATIRSVCDDTPPSIESVNPRIPSGLAQTIERLMAKDPDRRVQSAVELTELLEHNGGETTAPSPSPPGMSATKPGRGIPSAAQRWAVLTVVVAGLATVVVGLLFVGRPFLEGVGDDGPLLPRRRSTTQARVPAGAPNGNSALPSMTGASPPSSVSLNQAFSPLDRTPSQPPVFVLVSDPRAPGRSFNALTEAITTAQDGDTIEIHGSGTIQTPSIRLLGKRLILRAAAGSQPVFEVAPHASTPLITTDAALVLEGLTIRDLTAHQSPEGFAPPVHVDETVQRKDTTNPPGEVMSPPLIRATGPLLATNCRFVISSTNRVTTACIDREGVGPVHLNNCELYLKFGAAVWDRGSTGPDAAGLQEDGSPWLVMHNCVQTGFAAVAVDRSGSGTLQLSRNTVAGGCLIMFRPAGSNDPGRSNPAGPVGAFRVLGQHNIFDVRCLMIDPQQDPNALSTQHVAWEVQQNVFASVPVVGVKVPRRKLRSLSAAMMHDWRGFLGMAGKGSIYAAFHYASGYHPRDLVRSDRLQELAPSSFRLSRADGKRGRTYTGGVLTLVGAAIDTVGPGLAYQRFRLSDDYAAWTDAAQRAIHGPADAVQSSMR